MLNLNISEFSMIEVAIKIVLTLQRDTVVSGVSKMTFKVQQPSQGLKLNSMSKSLKSISDAFLILLTFEDTLLEYLLEVKLLSRLIFKSSLSKVVGGVVGSSSLTSSIVTTCNLEHQHSMLNIK